LIAFIDVAIVNEDSRRSKVPTSNQCAEKNVMILHASLLVYKNIDRRHLFREKIPGGKEKDFWSRERMGLGSGSWGLSLPRFIITSPNPLAVLLLFRW
jgi:hypothetical protein